MDPVSVGTDVWGHKPQAASCIAIKCDQFHGCLCVSDCFTSSGPLRLWPRRKLLIHMGRWKTTEVHCWSPGPRKYSLSSDGSLRRQDRITRVTDKLPCTRSRSTFLSEGAELKAFPQPRSNNTSRFGERLRSCCSFPFYHSKTQKAFEFLLYSDTLRFYLCEDCKRMTLWPLNLMLLQQ